MNKSIKVFAILFAAAFVAAGAAACGEEGEESTFNGASLAVTDYNYNVGGGTGVSAIVSFGDDKFVSVEYGGSALPSSAYVVSGSVVSIRSAYLDALGAGTYSFSIVTEKGSLPFRVTVGVLQDDFSVEDLIGPEYYSVTLGDGNGLEAVPTELTGKDIDKYIVFAEANKPLAVGESFDVDFGGDFQSMRLRPFNSPSLNALPYPSSFGDAAKTAYIYTSDENGPCLSIMTNGDGFPSNTGTVVFKGSKFLNGATYRLTVGYANENGVAASFSYGDGTPVCTLAGGVGEVSGTFTVKDNIYITGDHLWYYNVLHLNINSGVPAGLKLYGLKLERLS